jgi:3-hydroxyacyl-CoA dehydrogenase
VSNLVTLRRDGTIAVIIVDNPPVNALSHPVRAGLTEALSRAREDSGVEAIVLACAGRTFFAGADITEFGKAPQSPGLSDVIDALDAMPKPVVAAMHGTPLGGGLELALGCHFRIAAPGTRLGLPEIKLGLIPGAGGTQRLPRVVGMDKALSMILSGDPIPAKDALVSGLIDAIAETDVTQAAIDFAKKAVTEKKPMRRVRDREEKLMEFAGEPDKFKELAAKYLKRARGLDAPMAAVDSLRQAIDASIDAGLRFERSKFQELREGEQSKAQRHIFFAEREAQKVPGMPAGAKPREIGRIAVIGAGTMGGGIAMSFANAGLPVTLIETTPEALARGQGIIAKNYASTVARGGLKQEEMDKRVGLIQGTTDIGSVKDVDLVIEAVFEEMDIKKQVFGKLDALTKPDAIMATNTSYLDVNTIAQSTKRPSSVLGMHFFSPANVMKLLEIVRADKTSPELIATAIAVGRRIGKVPVVVGVCHGFVGNRMLRARSIEGERLLLEGALPAEVDAAVTEFGFPMGPFAMGDLAGLDISWRMRKAQGAKAEIADALCDMGRFGQKTNKGFYRYEAGSRTAIPDPEVEHLIVSTSKRLGIARRPISKQEIVERLIYPMINEGAKVLEEGVAYRPGDIDVIWIYGYGFPVWRGGPMHYADSVGLATIRDKLEQFARQSNDERLAPSALLKKLAAEGKTFASLAAKTG